MTDDNWENWMKRLMLAALLGVVCPLGFAGPEAANNGQVATFKNVSGNIDIARNDARLDAVSGMPLFVSDRIVSGTGASAGIVFNDGTQLTVGPSTDIEVRDYTFEPRQSRYDFFVYLARGAAIYTSGMMGRLAPEAIKVATPTATIGIRGTRFIIEAD
ncbi:FecR family protein [Hydrogenophaga sp.]|uniref:FecR family protein n=2 Tax=unclassified Hydrogenophaga TaxID=2610897 RepID=UPI003D2A722C